jgi:excisionase family DNA binding protein
MAEDTERRMLTVAQACQYLNLSRTTLYRMIKDKEVSPVPLTPGRTLFDRKDLDELIEKAKKPGQEPVRKKGRKGRAPKDEPSAGQKKSIRSTRSNRQK